MTLTFVARDLTEYVVHAIGEHLGAVAAWAGLFAISVAILVYFAAQALAYQDDDSDFSDEDPYHDIYTSSVLTDQDIERLR